MCFMRLTFRCPEIQAKKILFQQNYYCYCYCSKNQLRFQILKSVLESLDSLMQRRASELFILVRKWFSLKVEMDFQTVNQRKRKVHAKVLCFVLI